MLNTFWMTTRWALVPTVLSLIFTAILIPDFRWNNELFHVVIEGGGALIGFGLAFIVMAMIQKGQLTANYIWLIACFISMGMLDLVHSQQHPGQAFVWLHTAATFVGGLFAMLIWLPSALSEKFHRVRYFWAVLLLTIAFSIASLLWPDATPSMLDSHNQFTGSAKILNVTGSIGFLIAWLYFAREYHQYHHPQLFYFSNHFCLFALAGFVFEISALWDGNWWFWHMMRAFAYIFLMFHFAMVYRSKVEKSKQMLKQSLHESKTRYQRLIESSPDWVWEIDSNGVFTYSSPKVRDLLGYRPSDILGMTPFDLMPAEEAECSEKIFQSLSAIKSPVHIMESMHRHKNGQLVPLEVSGVPVLDEEGELLGYHGINHDISERKLNEQEIKSQQVFTNTILDVAGNIIVVLDTDGCFVRFNRAAEELTGYSSDEILGKPIWDWVIPEEQLTGVKTVFENLRKGDIEIAEQYENEWLTRDNDRRLLHWYNSVLQDNDGVISHIVALGYDITDIKESEEEKARMQRELQQAQKMESLGQLTGGIAHDFNNLLGIISGFTSLILNRCLDKTNENEKLAEYMERIQGASNRAIDLVSQMLAFSRIDRGEDRSVQCGPLVKEDIKMLRATLPSSIDIQTEIEPDLPNILMNPTQLNQILMNLIINGRDAMKGVGQLNIKLGWVRDLNTESPISHKPVTGDWIELSVSDTGSGIDIETAQKIFNPFFTTKEVGKGTGMGLAVVYGIMNKHNGHILFDSELGKGTTFRMLFSPVEDGTEDTTQTETTIELPEGNGAEILVVDDEPGLASYMAETINSSGYKATFVVDSAEALELFRKEPDRFAMLITDQTMPKITGIELIDKLHEIRPELSAILCSGYSDKINATEVDKRGIHFFDKPIDNDKLMLKIAELVN